MKKKIYKLSKDAIKYLDSIKTDNNSLISIKKITVKTNFIFQIEKIAKNRDCIYTSTLIDNDHRAGKFILFFDGKEKIPKKGDIIQIGQITKYYNKNYQIYIYECRNIEFIAKELNFIVDITKITNYNSKNEKLKKYGKHKDKINININNNKKQIEESEEEEEEVDNDDSDDKEDEKENYNNIKNNEINYEKEKLEERNNDNLNKININVKEKNNNIKGNLFNNDNKFGNNHNFLLISNLNANTKNFNIYVKCINKETIKEFRYKKNKLYQNYIFSDINNDKIEGVSFDMVSQKLDKILKINEFYQINNCMLIMNNITYCKVNFPYKLNLTKFTEIINISNNNIIRNKFENNYNEDRKDNENNNFLSLSNISNKNLFEVINVFGFVLMDYGNMKFYDKYNNEYYGRQIILGDDSNYKISITIWHPNDLKKEYKQGELLYIQNCKIKEYKNKMFLYGTRYRTIKPSFNPEYDSKLKKYYSEHKNIDNYLDINTNHKNNKINDINEDKNINNKNINNKNISNNYIYNESFCELIFLRNIIKMYNSKNYNKDMRFKISAYVKKINHSEKNYYYGCYNCRKKMLNDVCQNCGGKNKVIIIHFSISVIDCSSSFWLLLFGNIAENFLGIKGEEYKNILDKGISNDNKELKLLDNKVKDKQYIFIGKSQYISYDKFEGIRFYVKYFKKKNKKDYFSLINYLNNICN